MKSPKRPLRIFLRFSGIFFLLLLLAAFLFLLMIRVPAPAVDPALSPSSYTRQQTGPGSYRVGNSWLKKNTQGIWEMYIEGGDYERGLIYGVLAKELMEQQEKVFVDQIDLLVPNRVYQQFLKFFVAWFNRNIYKYIPEENFLMSIV